MEQRSVRPLLNGFHASWSVGAVAGGLVGTAAAALRVPPAVHFLATGAVLGAVVLVVRQRLIDDEERAGAVATGTKRRGGIGRPAPALLLLGLMVVFAAQIEDVPQSWSAVYLSDLGAGPGTAGLAFVAFSVFMTAGRLVGDRLVERLGPSAVVTGGGVLVALAFGVGLLVASPLATITGFALAGLGASPMFPVAFSMVGRLPGVLPGAGIATVSLVSRLGFLAAPLLVGGLVGLTTFQVALSVVVVAGLGAAALAPRLSRLQAPAGDASRPVD
ncbi:MFS transporter [Streptomyces flavidovirens]|uniref:MFS transporter n=1 Tax=Streptomyces flavidovirens TaxID=67298 RepID=UPI0034397739